MDTQWIKVTETGNKVEVNRSTAGEMVMRGEAEYIDAPKAAEKKADEKADK